MKLDIRNGYLQCRSHIVVQVIQFDHKVPMTCSFTRTDHWYFAFGQNASLAKLKVISVAAILGWIVMSHRLCSTRSTAQAVMCGAMVCWCMRYGHLERNHFLSFPHQRYIASSFIMGLLFVCVLCWKYVAHRMHMKFVRSLRIYVYY